MENQSRHRVSPFFPSPFASCRLRNAPDAVENSIIVTRNPSHVKPKKPISSTTQKQSIIRGKNEATTFVPDRKNSKSGSDTEGIRKCPPVTHTASVYSCCKNRAKVQSVIAKNSSSSYGGWFSSEEEEEEEEVEIDGVGDAFFSLSSDSSDTSRREVNLPRRQTPAVRRRRDKNRSYEMGRRPLQSPAFTIKSASFSTTSEIQVSESSTECARDDSGCFRREIIKFRRRRSGERSREIQRCQIEGCRAVVKDSRDPYRDFRESMVEMIMEKNMYGAEELQRLLQCFLSLNSSCHHRVIVEVFSEICEASLTP